MPAFYIDQGRAGVPPMRIARAARIRELIEELFDASKVLFARIQEHCARSKEDCDSVQEDFDSVQEHFGRSKEHFGRSKEHFGRSAEHCARSKVLCASFEEVFPAGKVDLDD